MKTIKTMKNFELAAYIQTCLMQKGIDSVLSGGACVSFYSANKYISMDLDLVNIHFVKRREIGVAMDEIGFGQEGRYYKHPDTRFFIEFLEGPLAFGAEPVRVVETHKLATGKLKIISPTDCVKDRLAGYYHWKDLQCLEQAVLVARRKKIDIKEIERWSKGEGKIEEFRHIRNRLVDQE